MRTAEKHLRTCYPKLKPLFDFVGPAPHERLDRRQLVVVVAEIVAGQMLSGQAADTICSRMRVAAEKRDLLGPHELTGNELRDCGLSRAKVRTIHEFSVAVAANPDKFQEWAELDYLNLKKEVSSFWGLSSWTSQMLAISYFGHSDIYPEADGTIKRTIGLIHQHLDLEFDFDEGSPFRTVLSRYLWASIDRGFWQKPHLFASKISMKSAE